MRGVRATQMPAWLADFCQHTIMAPLPSGSPPWIPALVLRRARDRAPPRRRPDGAPAKVRSHLLASSSRARRCPFSSLRIVLLIAVYFKPRFASPYS